MSSNTTRFTLKKQWYTRAKKLNSSNDIALTNDSEHESSSEDDCWQWIYEKKNDVVLARNKSSKRVSTEGTENTSMITKNTAKGNYSTLSKPHIIGAYNKDFQIKVGDAISVNCRDSVPWVAIVRSFDSTSRSCRKGKINILWLSSHTDISNKQKKRSDFLFNEVYLTPLKDSIDIDSINGKVELMSEEKFNNKYPNGIPKRLRKHGSVFICRRACETRGAIYTDEFVWEKIKPNNEEEVEKLYEHITAEIKSLKKVISRKRTNNDGIDTDKESKKLETPRKKQKFFSVTPRKLKTPSKLITPSHKKVIVKKPLEFTPLGTRVLDFDHVSSSPFQSARCHLHVSSVPASLPCREDEFASVYSHLEAAIIEGTGACIYISGTPGTGKTATVREVVAQLQAAVEAGELDPFSFVEINGLKIIDPVQSYSLLWEALKGERISPIHALDLLEREFTHPSPRLTPCVVLMDELDQLVTKNQLVMYNFFNWPNLRHSRLIVLAVANTMDLPERTLSNKISSRLGLTRITFPGYTYDQLMKIISSRLEGVLGKIVEKDAIEFASRKVAAVSGDARRVLDICRRAVELAEDENLLVPNPTTPSKTPGRSRGMAKVRIETIRRAIKEATTSPLQNYLKELPLSAKLLLIALVLRLRRTGIGEDTFGEVIDEAKKIAKQNSNVRMIPDFLFPKLHRNMFPHTSTKKNNPSDSPRVLAMGVAAMNLLDAGIIALESRRVDRAGKIRMCVGDQDIKIAFRDDPQVNNLGL